MFQKNITKIIINDGFIKINTNKKEELNISLPYKFLGMEKF